MTSVNHHSTTHEIFTFDDIVVDADGHTLRRNNILCDLEPKAFAVLLYLLAYPGEVITKDELLDAVWKHRCVTENVLSRIITKLRHALGDTAHHSRYIETVPTLGYRFIAEIQHRVTQKIGVTNQSLIFKKDLVHSSALLEEVKLLLSQLNGERNTYPALTKHFNDLIMLFGDKPSGMVLYELALEYGLEKLNGLDMELPWRNRNQRATDSDEEGED
jgi:DNA-binding winged helix-turn-helix (wHTH) protein